uniref:WAP domain-containing protein n=1 Tax=Chinchilla lanigera TaxID=34839 RepID=A0A8C2W2X7_CHILA
QQKPGVCPELPKGTIGLCAEFCSGDQSCPNDLKCCSNGCGHSCQSPVFIESDSGSQVKHGKDKHI